MISIGSVLMGPELGESNVAGAFRRVSQIAQSFREHAPPGSLVVNVVFVVPGSMGKPDFSEVRVLNYTRKRNVVVVEVPVPDGIATDESVFRHIVDAVDKAIVLAGAYLGKKKIQFDSQAASRSASELRSRLLAT